MSLKLDMERGVAAGNDNFHAELIRLMQKADPGNYARLKTGFPNTAEVFEAWRAGQPIPDLPYESSQANAHDDLLSALTKIADSPEGVYRVDPLEYAHNVIEWCQETARTAIAAAKAVPA